ncbi:MAG TPA: murein transglycosylase A [Casimicrobiaceae bacterium]|nr:murein transglycosylase A [Casimicrobiaceae bacterium]
MPPKLTRVTWADLPGFGDDRVSDAWPALVVGCRALVAAPKTRTIWQRPCDAARLVDGRDDNAVRAYLRAHFSPYVIASTAGDVDGLVTGYYEPMLEGSRMRTDRYRTPLYGVPDDLVVVDLASLHPELAGKRVRGRLEGRRVVPYPPRGEIEKGHAPLAGKAIAWIADPLDAFFLQIQGSGRIALAEGGTLRLGYADQNGHPYRAIANVLIARGEMTLAQASLQSIREWAKSHPADVPALLDENPSYVFFRELPAPLPGTLDARIDGPHGSLGVPLLARRTIAVDARSIPLGAPVWIATRSPVTGAPIERLVLAQDTGGAIRGAVRADFFWGSGRDAEDEAGRMRERGRLWMLWPIDAPLL